MKSNATRETRIPNSERRISNVEVKKSKPNQDNTDAGGKVPAESKRPKYDLEERLLDFAGGIVAIVESLPGTRSANHVGGQLIRCGTSPLANYAEAQSAESRKDFVHKLKIVLKELRETRVWLLLIERRSMAKMPERAAGLLAECDELIAIFRASIGTAERNRPGSKTGA